MKTYEGSQRSDEWQIWSTLEMHEEGKFVYSEEWTCYAGGNTETASGNWLQVDGSIIFDTQESTLNTWPAGREQTAREEAGRLVFSDGLTLSIS